MGYGSASIATNTAANVVSANAQRISLIVTNIGTGPVFLGPDNSVTSANGTKLITNGTLSEDLGMGSGYKGPVWARAGSLGTTVTYWERTR